MRKYFLLLTLILSLLCLSGCSSERCDICDKRGADNTVEAVTTWILCDDCYNDLSLPSTSYDFGSDYDYSYDDYDDDTDYSGSYGSFGGSCADCGASIESDRIYCNSCLGFGVCQDCGVSVSDDRLYCDSCLGFGVCQDCGTSIASDRLYCDSCLFDQYETKITPDMLE